MSIKAYIGASIDSVISAGIGVDNSIFDFFANYLTLSRAQYSEINGTDYLLSTTGDSTRIPVATPILDFSSGGTIEIVMDQFSHNILVTAITEDNTVVNPLSVTYSTDRYIITPSTSVPICKVKFWNSDLVTPSDSDILDLNIRGNQTGVVLQFDCEEGVGEGTNEVLFDKLTGQTASLTGVTFPEVWSNTYTVPCLLNQVGYSLNTKYQQVIPLRVTAGLFDFSFDAPNKLWIFKDGSTSTVDRPTRTLTEDQVVLLICDCVNGNYSLRNNSTASNYIGNTRDLANLTYYANFFNTNIEGDIQLLANLTYFAHFGNTNVEGNIQYLSNLTYYANFFNTNIEGDIQHLSNLTYLAEFSNTNVEGDIQHLANLAFYAGFENTNVYGIVPVGCTAYRWYLNGTQLSKTDIEQSLINLDTTGHTRSGAIFECNNHTIDDPAALAAKASLESKGWTINVITV